MIPTAGLVILKALGAAVAQFAKSVADPKACTLQR
jgi:hypothetical protein